MERTNWAGNYAYQAQRLHRPGSVEELQGIVSSARSLRVLGSRHSFSGIADSSELLTLDGLPRELNVNGPDAVTITANLAYGELAPRLQEHGLALANLASLPHISVAGAVATGTHGSGERNGALSTAVAGLEAVTSDGELVRTRRGDPDFAGVVVGLGACGVITRLTLGVEPAYDVRQTVYEGLGWDALLEHFDAIMGAGYSVSVFTLWEREAVRQVWVKRRDGNDAPADLFGARQATADVHPIPGVDPVNCTAQRGVPGPWFDRLPHFRMNFMPSSGEEIQSEYLVPRASATAAIQAVRELAAEIRPLVQISEIRAIAADELWLSPAYGRDTIAIHFTWRLEPAAVERVLDRLEASLQPFGARPHWGKLFRADARQLAPLYERHADFVNLVDRLDPRGVFVNDWLKKHVLA